MRRELRCILLGLMILIPASGLFARALHKQGQQYITKRSQEPPLRLLQEERLLLFTWILPISRVS